MPGLDLNALRHLGFSKRQSQQLAQQFSSGGGGFKGNWQAGSYQPGDIVSAGGYLWTPRVATTQAPVPVSGGLTSNPLTNTTDWSQNNVSSISGSEVTLINNVGGTNAAVTTKKPFATSLASLDLTFSISALASGTADAIGIGLIDPNEANASGSSAPQNFGSITGLELNIFNSGGLTAIRDGARSAAAAGGGSASYRTLTLKLNSTTMTISDSLGGQASYSYQWPKPYALATVWARTGGSSGVFKASVSSLIGQTAPSDWRRLAVLVDAS